MVTCKEIVPGYRHSLTYRLDRTRVDSLLVQVAECTLSNSPEWPMLNTKAGTKTLHQVEHCLCHRRKQGSSESSPSLRVVFKAHAHSKTARAPYTTELGQSQARFCQNWSSADWTRQAPDCPSATRSRGFFESLSWVLWQAVPPLHALHIGPVDPVGPCGWLNVHSGQPVLPVDVPTPDLGKHAILAKECMYDNAPLGGLYRAATLSRGGYVFSTPSLRFLLGDTRQD